MSSSSSSGGGSQDGEKKERKKKKEKESFVAPLEVEEEIDKEMLQFAIEEGITDEQFLQGKMSLRTCQVMSESKLKHRTCKYSNFLILIFEFVFYCSVETQRLES